MRLSTLFTLVCFAALSTPCTSYAEPPTINTNKTSLDNGGTIVVSGQAAPDTAVYIEVTSDAKVQASFFDAKKDDTGQIPYRLYLSQDVPAYYRIYLPASKADITKAAAAEGRAWPYSKVLKDTGADVAYRAPASARIDAYQSSLMASIIGSRGEKLPDLNDKERRRRSMQLVKARFRSVNKLLVPNVKTEANGSYTASVEIPSGSAPGAYQIVAVTAKGERSAPLKVENNVAFPMVYLTSAGTSLNVLWPFLLALGIGIFGVLMGAGGGFMLNPLLVSLWPLPHTIVAGTVMPTVLFSQASGIFSYTRIKFISWKLGLTLGVCMLAGGFIGPKLTELITLDQFKFVFGWILFVLAGLLLWQTTPAYLRKNAKEQAIMKEFKARAEREAQARNQPAVPRGSKTA